MAHQHAASVGGIPAGHKFIELMFSQNSAGFQAIEANFKA
jgi:hypothetical protein